MQISEFSFPHLHAAHDERLSVELERQRIAAERRAESTTQKATSQEATTRDATVRAGGRGIRSWWSGRTPAAQLVARGPANDPCPTCP